MKKKTNKQIEIINIYDINQCAKNVTAHFSSKKNITGGNRTSVLLHTAK